MMNSHTKRKVRCAKIAGRRLISLLAMFSLLCLGSIAQCKSLADMQKDGVLRHLGVPYAGFVTGDGGGLSVELMQLFAKELGVEYQYVQTSWKDVINDLVGRKVVPDGDNVTFAGDVAVRGDIIANGLTIIPWRQKVVDYSAPVFPTQVWLITDSRSPMKPITPSGSINTDIETVKNMLNGKTVLGKQNTCLDPSLYSLEEVNAISSHFEGGLNELAPAVMNGDAESTLLDVPDALVALAKWPGQIKVLGPVSPPQEMGVGFPKNTPELQKAFAVFYDKLKKDGTYQALVKKYYPDVFDYYPDFFTR